MRMEIGVGDSDETASGHGIEERVDRLLRWVEEGGVRDGGDDVGGGCFVDCDKGGVEKEHKRHGENER